jgi:hypothetical protein
MKDNDDRDFIKMKTYDPPAPANYSQGRFARDCNIMLLLIIGIPLLIAFVLISLVRILF